MTPIRVAQDAQIFLLPEELRMHLGKFLPDVKSVVAFTATCSDFHPLRFKIITRDAQKIQAILEKALYREGTFPPEFLNQCTFSPHREFPFSLKCPSQRKAGQTDEIAKIRNVLPNARVGISAAQVLKEHPEFFQAQARRRRQTTRCERIAGIFSYLWAAIRGHSLPLPHMHI